MLMNIGLEGFTRKEGLEELAKESGFLPFTCKHMGGYKHMFCFSRSHGNRVATIYIFAFDDSRDYHIAGIYDISRKLIRRLERDGLQLDLKNDLDPLYLGWETVDILKRFSKGSFNLLP